MASANFTDSQLQYLEPHLPTLDEWKYAESLAFAVSVCSVGRGGIAGEQTHERLEAWDPP